MKLRLSRNSPKSLIEKMQRPSVTSDSVQLWSAHGPLQTEKQKRDRERVPRRTQMHGKLSELHELLYIWLKEGKIPVTSKIP